MLIGKFFSAHNSLSVFFVVAVEQRPTKTQGHYRLCLHIPNSMDHYLMTHKRGF